jgi:protein-disulfide isomerase
MGKRQELREKRKRQERMQMFWIILGAALIVISVGGGIIISQNQPVEGLVYITPEAGLPNPNGMELGDPAASVVIEVWEDFQCPSCARYSEGVEPQVIANLVATGKARYIFHNYAFIGSESVLAANAAMCALEQGRFWDYKKMIYANQNGENQGWFTEARMRAFANALDLDMTKFNTCLSDRPYQSEIQDDFDLGQEVGVSGTPSVFVNRVIVTPGYIPSYEDIAAAVEAALGQ